MPLKPLQLANFLPYRLSITSNLVSEKIAAHYESLFGLTVPEWRILAVVAERGASTQQAVCQLTRMDKVTVSRAAIALTDRGVLIRSPNPDDKRSHLLSLSAVGIDLYEAIAPRALAAESQVFSCLNDDERRSLMQLLARIDDYVDGCPPGTDRLSHQSRKRPYPTLSVKLPR